MADDRAWERAEADRQDVEVRERREERDRQHAPAPARAEIGQIYEFPPEPSVQSKGRGNRYEIYREKNGLLYGRSLDGHVFDIHGGPEAWPRAATLVREAAL